MSEHRQYAPVTLPLGGGISRADDHTFLQDLIRTLDTTHPAPDRLAASFLAHFGSAGMALSAHVGGLDEVAGRETALPPLLAVAREAALRLYRARVRRTDVLAGRAGLEAYLQACMGHEVIEQFRVLFLDEGFRLLADELMGTGTVNHSPVYPREIMRRALALGARLLVLAHNHPAGQPEPSPADIEMTLRIAQIGRIMQVTVHDHIIVGNGRTHSFREAGLLI
ncbi:DNA repair protein RadC [Komagataeibacter oboediens]|uniref:JAB domain-containing protein n=1 Tax=Komagataeibacter oboediens TaxID=65958 RepID=UPI001C2CB942|nr:DNA repair protein RadC [Komagataeibacter oboediens]MBV0888509.1 DNA repair protein RadC [Komagataeibacter oboediens]MCK9819236.1 DNA repair protein RadC [Komagataeibacter oboediens]WEQ53646.1 DNA repair protein RadC [Komagataeibacter oboediens]